MSGKRRDVVLFGDTGAWIVPVEHGKQNEVRKLRGLRIVRSLSKSTSKINKHDIIYIIGSSRAGAGAEPPEQRVPHKMRSLRGLRIVRSLRKSTADCTAVKQKSAELMLRTNCCTLLNLRVSASVSLTAVQSRAISQNSQNSQNSHIVNHVPAVCLTAMPCNKAGMDIPPAARIAAMPCK